MKIMSDAVNPNHYKDNDHQIIEVIRWMDFSPGNAIKYVYRYARKESPIQDLRKALWYLEDYYTNTGFKIISKDVHEKIVSNNFVKNHPDGFIKNTVLNIINLYLSKDEKSWCLQYAYIHMDIKNKISELDKITL